ncbi:hypothetical protein M9H77_12759 [Catharanthus roseus]|uniref:Uncharacterized protein n=1 Tax=Catharanthus roseus TaxID=4058 RepID=A0ACC0BI83_CATRO|nr:hypothetical protein M9H77_12759 [Catharanthus roseus]
MRCEIGGLSLLILIPCICPASSASANNLDNMSKTIVRCILSPSSPAAAHYKSPEPARDPAGANSGEVNAELRDYDELKAKSSQQHRPSVGPSSSEMVIFLSLSHSHSLLHTHSLSPTAHSFSLFNTVTRRQSGSDADSLRRRRRGHGGRQQQRPSSGGGGRWAEYFERI